MRKIKKEVTLILIILFLVSFISAQKCPENLAQCSSEELKNFHDFILINGIKSDKDSLANQNVLDEFDKRIQKNPSILNKNPDIKKQWFKIHEINDRGAVIEDFDGENVRLKGEHSTSFRLSDFSGAEISEKGLSINNAVLTGDIEKLEDKTIIAIGNYFEIKDNSYESVQDSEKSEPFTVTIDGEKISIKGKKITEKDNKGNTVSEFDGEIVKKQTKKILKKETRYSSFHDNERSVTYEVNEDVEFITDLRVPEKATTYIRDSVNLVEIKDPKEDMEITVHNDLIERFIIDDNKEIGFVDTITIKDEKGNSLSFSQGLYTGKGKITELPGVEYKYPENKNSIKVNYRDLGILETEDYVKTGKYFEKLDSYLNSYGIELENKKISLAYSNKEHEVFITSDGGVIIINKLGEPGKNIYYSKGDQLQLVNNKGNLIDIENKDMDYYTAKYVLENALNAVESNKIPSDYGYESMVPELDDFQKSVLMKRIENYLKTKSSEGYSEEKADKMFEILKNDPEFSVKKSQEELEEQGINRFEIHGYIEEPKYLEPLPFDHFSDNSLTQGIYNIGRFTENVGVSLYNGAKWTWYNIRKLTQ
ncbi:hypothetical protein GF386_04440 [Candidatus Pacearchaeota archaeon]|nr:hypothetical protein [Candidatus Pacearchaeota archaeon]MBD3283373.1 hypothetical protein [Candidatus Pacearchaeota archaeon]